MAEITSATIKSLRETTGAGMMDCKKALQECDGDIETAKDWLRQKGLAAAAKKSGRTAAEGLVAIAENDNKQAAAIELNSETDFVSRNENFQEAAKTIAEAAIAANGDIDTLKQANYPGSDKTVDEQVAELVGSIGENLQLRRTGALSVENGIVATYIHNSVAPGLGKIAVLVALESEGDEDKLQELGKQIAMHVAAAKPEALNREGVDPALLEREKQIFIEQAKDSGKPENIIEKMVEGRINKFYGEIVLLEQLFVVDGKTKITDVITEAEKTVGAPITLKDYIRLALGEGVEKKEENFAEEVAAAANQ